MSNQEIIAAEPRPVTVAASSPGAVLAYAIEKGADIAHIERLLDLQMKWEANEARKAFVADMAEFKKNPPKIVKDKLVGYENKDGSVTGYKHATLGNVTNAVVEGLAAHGFSHRWDVKQDGPVVQVACTITHRMGHSESVVMQAGKDDSGKKNLIQQVASAVSYLQRYTLLAASGLATHDQDDDAQAAGVDPELADTWIAKANAAATPEALEQVWQAGSDAIVDANDLRAYFELKKAVNERKGALLVNATESNPAGNGKRPSRLNTIVNQQAAE